MPITIITNRTRISSLDDLRENFNSAEFLAYLKSGRIIRWLNDLGEAALAEKIAAMNPEDKTSIKSIMKLLSISEDKCPILEVPEAEEKEISKSERGPTSSVYLREAETQEEKTIADGRDRLLDALNSCLNSRGLKEKNIVLDVETPFSKCGFPSSPELCDTLMDEIVQTAGLTEPYLHAKANILAFTWAADSKANRWLMYNAWKTEHIIVFTPFGFHSAKKKGRKINCKFAVQELYKQRKTKFFSDPFTVADLLKLLYCGSKQLIPTLKKWDELNLDLLLQLKENIVSDKKNDEPSSESEIGLSDISFEDAEKCIASAITIMPMPRLGQSEETVTIQSWRVREGDTVKKGDVLFDVETDKCVLDVESQIEGTIQKILIPAGEGAAIAAPVCIITSKNALATIPAHVFYVLGKGYIQEQQKPLLGLFFIKLAAEHDDAAAQYMLSTFFCAFGGSKFCPQEITDELEKHYSAVRAMNEGEKWLNKAAGNGNADAQFDLGLIKCTGCDSEEYDEGLQLIQLAADKNHEEALLCMKDPDAYFIKLSEDLN